MLENDNAELERLVDEGTDRLEVGDPSGALRYADQALSRWPRAVAALHLRAAALVELGRLEEARSAYDQALGVGVDDLDLLADAAEFYLNSSNDPLDDPASLDRAHSLVRHGAQLALRNGDACATSTFALLEARVLADSGRPHEALSRIEEALRSSDGDLDLLAERGLMLFEVGSFQDAREQLQDVVRADARHAWAQHTLGLIAERAGDHSEAELRFSAARREAPEEFPRPVELSPDAFDAAVEDALASLPEQVRAYLSNVAIAIEDLPADDDLLASDPPLSPSILGVFRGAPLGDKASMDPWNHFPSSIVLYQKNLERFAASQIDLVDQIGITLIHEVGHFLGLDETDLRELGLD